MVFRFCELYFYSKLEPRLQPCGCFVKQLEIDRLSVTGSNLMRVEVENEVGEIRQSLELLRRRL